MDFDGSQQPPPPPKSPKKIVFRIDLQKRYSWIYF
jgi:hypothetical protein